MQVNTFTASLARVLSELQSARKIWSDPSEVAAVTDGDYTGLDDGDYAEVDALLAASRTRFDPGVLAKLLPEYQSANIQIWKEIQEEHRQSIAERSAEFEAAISPHVYQTWSRSFGGRLDDRLDRLFRRHPQCSRTSVTNETRNLVAGASCLGPLDKILWSFAVAAQVPTTHGNRAKVLAFIVLSCLGDPEGFGQVPGEKREFNFDLDLENLVLSWLVDLKLKSENRQWCGCFLLANLGDPLAMLPRDRDEVQKLPGQNLDVYLKWELDAIEACIPADELESYCDGSVPARYRSKPMTLTDAGRALSFGRTEDPKSFRNLINGLKECGKLRVQQTGENKNSWYFDLRDIRMHYPHQEHYFRPDSVVNMPGKVGR